MDSFVSMLGTNKTFDHVTLTLTDEVYERYATRLKRHHDESPSGTREPFPLQCHLAFLSVFEASQGRGAKRTKQERPTVVAKLASFPVDRNVVAIIFAFAAERVHRQVHINGDF